MPWGLSVDSLLSRKSEISNCLSVYDLRLAAVVWGEELWTRAKCLEKYSLDQRLKKKNEMNGQELYRQWESVNTWVKDPWAEAKCLKKMYPELEILFGLAGKSRTGRRKMYGLLYDLQLRIARTVAKVNPILYKSHPVV